MGGSLTDDLVAWTQRFTGLDVSDGDPHDGQPAADVGCPAPDSNLDALSASIQDLVAGFGGELRFDLPADGGAPGKPGPDAAKLAADVKKINDAAKDWADRRAKITLTYEMAPVAKSFEKAVAAFVAVVEAGAKKNDLTDAVKAIAAVEKALKALEADAAKRAKDLPKKQKAATDAGDKVDKLPDADVAKMKPEDKAALVKEMLGAGKPTGKVRDAQKKLYRNTGIDPDYAKDDKARQDKVAADLKGDKELAAARANWNKLDKDGLRKMLGKVVAAQSKEYGIPPPAIVFFPDEEPAVTKGAGTVLGYFSDRDGKLHINLDPTAGIKDFIASMDVVLHENAHHYQAELAKMLEAGKLKPKDPRYKQALMFAVNELEPGGYIDPDEAADPRKGVADYKAQPLERSAFETGSDTAAKVGSAVKPPGP